MYTENRRKHRRNSINISKEEFNTKKKLNSFIISPRKKGLKMCKIFLTKKKPDRKGIVKTKKKKIRKKIKPNWIKILEPSVTYMHIYKDPQYFITELHEKEEGKKIGFVTL